MKTKLIVLAAALALAGCFSDKSTPSGPSEARRPGQIQLVAMNGLAKGAAANSYTFSLDTARSSFQQYFILQNTGDVEITDIELTTNNPNFTFSPSRIASLAPSEGASVIQVIKLNVVHGKRLDGVGFGDYLTAGPVSVNVVIAGETLDEENEVIAVGDSVTLSTFAQVAAFSVTTPDSTFDIGSMHPGLTFGAPFSQTSVPHYYIPVDSAGLITVKNTGNVALTVRRWEPNGFTPLSTLTLAPDSSFTLTGMALEFDAHGVTFSPSTLPVLSNGKLQLFLYAD
jgi:hypothetical protein